MDTNGARAYTTPGEQEPSPAEALRRLQQQVGELQAYLTHFVSAKVDGFVLSARQLAIWAALGVAGLLRWGSWSPRSYSFSSEQPMALQCSSAGDGGWAHW
jgi:hypothetical protein